ncbi:kinase-like domain-containing protein [Powellomyces hirtus]|nr:kinase-like domain-containing protein [Powellomyces hirtus]
MHHAMAPRQRSRPFPWSGDPGTQEGAETTAITTAAYNTTNTTRSMVVSPRRRPSTALIHVPRPSPPWTVVLHSSARRDAAVVLYNATERKLAVQRCGNGGGGRGTRRRRRPRRGNDGSEDVDDDGDDDDDDDDDVDAGRMDGAGYCPLCRRPWGSTRDAGVEATGERGQEDGGETQVNGARLGDAEYFGLLALVAPDSLSENDEIVEQVDEGGQHEESEEGRRDQSGSVAASMHTSAATTAASAAGAASSSSSSGLHASSFNQGYYDRFFVEERKLGRGLRGSVFLCQHVLDQVPLGQFAVKAIPVGTSHAWLVRMLKEVHLLERLRHPNITEYKHAWLENRQLTLFGPEVPCLFILMALANGGNLEEYIFVQWHPDTQTSTPQQTTKTINDDSSDSDLPPTLTTRERAVRLRDRKRRRLSSSTTLPDSATASTAAAPLPPTSTAARRTPAPTRAQLYGGIGRATPHGRKVRYLNSWEIWCLFLDICKGLAHLHAHGIIHRDLKPPNLLLQFADPNERNEIPRVLISDFGECEVLAETQTQTHRERTGATGTLEFMAPELLEKDPATGSFFNDQHSPSADLWSLGVVLYFLCYSTVPYSQIEDVDALREEIVAFRSVTFPDHGSRVSPELQHLITALLSRSGRDRPTAQDILNTYGHLGTPLQQHTTAKPPPGSAATPAAPGEMNPKAARAESVGGADRTPTAAGEAAAAAGGGDRTSIVALRPASAPSLALLGSTHRPPQPGPVNLVPAGSSTHARVQFAETVTRLPAKVKQNQKPPLAPLS